VLGGVRYYDRKEIKDMMAYLRLVENTDDDVALARIINEPKRGVGDKTLEKLRTLAAVRGESLFETLEDDEITSGLSAKAMKGVRELVSTIREYSQEKENLSVSDIYDGLMVKTGYLKSYEEQNNVEADSKIENMFEFKSVIYDFEKEQEKKQEQEQLTLSEFMEKVALMSDIDNHDANEDAVVLMTMHSAKGLEFPVVFLPGMEDGLFPGWRALEKEDGLEEERRLCYVGMTRAMKKLYLLSANMRTLYGKTDYTQESQFLRELDKSLLAGDAVYERKTENRYEPNWSDGYSSETVFKPFDQLKYAKQEVKKSVLGFDEQDFSVGDKVNHAKFGDGLVVEVDSKTVSVIFDSLQGYKKLGIGFAPLKRIE
jgi:DNA helicase-2/ATP-dependent DNA helicase PcrA